MTAHQHDGAVAPGPVTPPTNKLAPDAANVEGPGQTETQCCIFEQLPDDSKGFATLRALLALKGYSLHRTAVEDGPVYFYVTFYVTRWGLVRELRDIAAVRAFAEQAGVKHG